jgi:PhnB protein
MKQAVKPIPEGYHTLTPYLIIKGASQAIEFYKNAFRAKEVIRLVDESGKIGHAEMLIGNSYVMLADEVLETGHRSPQSLGGSPVSLLVYVENVDEVVTQAVNSGAKLIRAVQDQFYGDRVGGVEDPFGHIWYIATHIEDLSAEEIQARMTSNKA